MSEAHSRELTSASVFVATLIVAQALGVGSIRSMGDARLSARSFGIHSTERPSQEPIAHRRWR